MSKNLKSHESGQTVKIRMQTLVQLGYQTIDAKSSGRFDAKVIDGCYLLTQHREHIVWVEYR